MIAKLFEAYFQRMWLFLIPPILMPLVVTPAAFFLSVSYETRAAVWVERPSYLRSAADDVGRLTTPAQSQGARLTELLRSRTFLMDVASQTPLAPLVGSTKGEDRIMATIEKGLVIAPSGTNLLAISFEAPSAELSFQFVDALVQRFQERAESDRRGQADQAMSFYEERLQTAEDQLAKSHENVRRYIGSNPRLQPGDRSSSTGLTAPVVRPSDSGAAAVDPRLAELMARVDLDERDVERARAALDDTRLRVSASAQGQELGFQLIDPPRMPTEPRRSLKKLLVFPVGAVVAGLGISVALLLLMIATDRSARSEADLSGSFPVIATVPRLSFTDFAELVDEHTARQSIGIMTVKALPAPVRNEAHGSSV